MNIEILINKLIEYYNVRTITELAVKLDTTQSTISGWRARNAIGALTEKVASVDPQALSSIFSSSNQINNLQGAEIAGSGVDNSQGSSHKFTKASPIPQEPVHNTNTPIYILEDLNSLFNRAAEKDRVKDVAAAIEDFIHEQKKLLRD